MPIVDYDFKDRIFFAREIGNISANEGYEWAERLAKHADESEQPIVALVEALKAISVSPAATRAFADVSFHKNVLAVVVATNVGTSALADVIGRVGKQGKTHIFLSLEQARAYAESLVSGDTLPDNDAASNS